MCFVINRRVEQEDIYIGRGSIWGNKFIIGIDGSRKEVIAQYKADLWKRIKAGEITTAMLKNLHGKKLGCYCKPKNCHGDILVQAVLWAMKLEQ